MAKRGLNRTHREGPGCPSNFAMPCIRCGGDFRFTAPSFIWRFCTSHTKIFPSRLPLTTNLLSGVHETSSPLLPLDGSMDSLRDGTDCLRSEARRDGGSERFGIMLGIWVLRAVKAEVS